jgi:rod shape-determining protein MreD
MEKFKWIRYFAYSIELLVLFMVQETPGLIPALFGARPVLLIPVALSIALFENERASLLFGLFSGLMIDFGMGETLGFHALLLTVVCYYIALIAANLIKTNFLTAMLTVTVTSAVLFLLQWVFYFVLYNYQDAGYVLSVHYLPRFFYTVAVMPIVYYFNRALAIQIRAKEE